MVCNPCRLDDALGQVTSPGERQFLHRLSGDNRSSHPTGMLQALNEIMGKVSSSSWPRRSCAPQAFLGGLSAA